MRPTIAYLEGRQYPYSRKETPTDELEDDNPYNMETQLYSYWDWYDGLKGNPFDVKKYEDEY